MCRKPSTVPPLVSAPPVICGTSHDQWSSNHQTLPIETLIPPNNDEPQLLPPNHIISQLCAGVHHILASVPDAQADNVIARFGGDLMALADPIMGTDDLWEEVLNLMMKRHLGWREEILGTDLV